MSAQFLVAYAPQARNDLHAIVDYIEHALSTPQAAYKQSQRIRNAIHSLEAFPERHTRVDWEPWQSLGVRRLSIGNYAVFYRVETAEHRVTIMRIVYGGRNLSGLVDEA